jgi:hypothetical protein
MAKTKATIRNISKCVMTVQGYEMNCPVCEQLVPDGYSHECKKDGGVTEARTWVTGRKDLGGVCSLTKEATEKVKAQK